MNTPRIEVNLSKIRHNTKTIVRRLQARGIDITGVTKSVCGHPVIAQAMLDGGVVALADARLSNVKRLRAGGCTCPVTLIRTPMLSQTEEVVQFCDASYNTEMTVVAALAAAAGRQGKVHGIILMVEMGDKREGILPVDVVSNAQKVTGMPGVELKGIGANFACLSGIAPNAEKMAALSVLAIKTETQIGCFLQTVSGGNSANLPWAFEEHCSGRINDLRMGEAILLGVEPVSGERISGMYTDAFTLVAEVIETALKPLSPPLSIVEPALKSLHLAYPKRVILALGDQDTNIMGLSMPPGYTLVGATSDHLVLASNLPAPRIGTELRFQLTYRALMRAMAARDINTTLLCAEPPRNARRTHGLSKHLAAV